jgi:GTP cyclohydrolase II
MFVANWLHTLRFYTAQVQARLRRCKLMLSSPFETSHIAMSDASHDSPSVSRKSTHIRLTSHPAVGGTPVRPIHWGASDPIERGPIIGTTTNKRDRNVVGTHSGSYGIYRALAMAAGTLGKLHKADLTNTSPTDLVGPYPAWYGTEKIVSIDPLGAVVADVFKDDIERGIDLRPTIAVTKARVHLPEIKNAIVLQRLKPDGKILLDDASAVVTKAAVEPVWWLPGVAKRFGCSEADLRRVLFEETGGMYPELVTRSDIEVFLPPIGSQTIYVFGDIRDLSNPNVKLTARIHDECNGSDVFGSDICTCRPYLTHAIEECIRGAQEGGVGLIVYCRKEGRALGEVTKFLVYNARKRQVGGDSADKYFLRTECVAGVQDMRFQELMPDIFHWLGITRIHRLVSMSNMKYDAIVGSGIQVDERVPIPDDMIPADAQVEMQAKMAAGYFTVAGGPDATKLKDTVGRGL